MVDTIVEGLILRDEELMRFLGVHLDEAGQTAVEILNELGCIWEAMPLRNILKVSN